MDLLRELSVGIWGLGVVGKSVASFLDRQGIKYSVYDSKLTPEKSLETFLEDNQIIIPSPGIDLNPYKKYSNKFLAEVDLFFKYFKKPAIAITGSLGKTTVTFLLDQMLKQNGIRSVAGGNIGLAMCSLIEQQKDIDIAVLELSSFQLEHSHDFYSNLAVLTNLYPNHLDRHGTLENYKQAKLNLFRKQTPSDVALIPLSLHADVKDFKSCCYFFSSDFDQFDKFKNVYYLEKETVCFWDGRAKRPIIQLSQEQKDLTFLENWLIVCAVLDLKKLKKFDLSKDAALPKHRMERISIEGVTFYNDSKSTVMEATLKAVESCNQPILFLGGLSKGADRGLLIAQLKTKVRFVICFGKEAEDLDRLCKRNGISSKSFKQLEAAVKFCLDSVQKGDDVLFSPGGSSFDLFENYCARGDKFKELILGI